MSQSLHIGNMLIEQNLITAKQLDDALKKQHDLGKSLSSILINSGAISEKVFLEFFSKQTKLPYIELAHYNIDREICRILPENYARHFQAILLAKEEDEHYLVGMVDPVNIFATDELCNFLKKPVKLAIVSEKELLYTLDQIYRRTDEINEFVDKLASELQQPFEIKTSEALPEQVDPTVLKLLNSIFEDAVQVNASDIHIEPAKNLLRLRLRVDGLLQEQIIPLTNKDDIRLAVAQRLKLMAKLNIEEKRLPQDGSFEIEVHNAKLDVRLSTMPNQYGEVVVMRLHNKTNKIIELDKIGMPKETLGRFRKIIKTPCGMVLVTGPTGSGKTTTLYSALSEISDVTKNIVTIEDPIEHQLERANQTQVNPQIDLTFAKILKSILRQDPNVILVGEIRDQETASIAMHAALTGQLVFATLHTNDAVSTPIRLIDIGVEGYLIASTVRAILAQRLARRICSYCLTSYSPTEQEISDAVTLFGDTLIKQINFSHGAGCTHCNFTGFKGRVGVFELFELDNQMRDALRVQDINEYVKIAFKNRTSPNLLFSAIELARQGIITLSEVSRVAGEQI